MEGERKRAWARECMMYIYMNNPCAQGVYILRDMASY